MNKQCYRIDIIDTSFQDYVPDMTESETQPISAKCVEPRRRRESIGGWFPKISVIVRTPKLPPSDFFAAPVVGNIAISERVHEDFVMRGMLETLGELLPMEISERGSCIYCFNSLNRVLCEGVVDAVRCEKKFGRLSRIAFHDSLLPDGGIFTVPEAPSRLFAVHCPDLAPNVDFVQWYRKQGYTGLKLIEAEKAYM